MLLPPTAPQPLTPAEIRALEVFYSAWKEKKPELLHEVCIPDWQDIPLGPGQAPGPGGLGGIIGAFTAAFPDLGIIIHEQAGVQAKIRFTNQHDIPGAVPPGQPVSISLQPKLA